MTTPTLIGMPEPPSNPETPTEAPGTPNSTTTSLSALSTTAIKDGHRGIAHPSASAHHQHTLSSNTLEAQRADRISRLAGLERVTTATPSNPNPSPAPAGGQIPGYFDQNGNPVYTTRMSTVGTASATGSAGGRTTTWASGSTKQTEGEGEEDYEMDMDGDRDRFSVSVMDDDGDGMSDDQSLVGFGEGAGSTVSGPISSFPGRRVGGIDGQVKSGLAKEVPAGEEGEGKEAAEKILRERQVDDGKARGAAPLGSPDDKGLGKFYFEENKK